MKIWLKLLIGSAVGVLVAVLVPATTGVADVFGFLSSLLVRIGRFVVFPLVFFSLCIGTYELRREKRAVGVYGRAFAVLVGSSALLAAIGVLACILVSPARIPIPVEEAEAVRVLSLRQLLYSVFPANLFSVLTGDANLLLPLMVLALVLGSSLDFENVAPRILIQVGDALSRVFYHINALVSELIGIGLIAISASLVLQIRLSDLASFRQLIMILAIETVIVLFGIYPLLLYALGVREAPYRRMYAALGPAIAGFVTGDVTFSLGVVSRHGKDSFGVPRSVGTAVYPLFAFLGRAGTAMVTGTTFILILRSYSSLEIGVLEVLWVMLMTFLVSFTLGSAPGSGTVLALAMLCSLYGKGRQDAYLVVKPALPILVSFGALLDVVTSSLAGFLVGRDHPGWKDVETKDYV